MLCSLSSTYGKYVINKEIVISISTADYYFTADASENEIYSAGEVIVYIDTSNFVEETIDNETVEKITEVDIGYTIKAENEKYNITLERQVEGETLPQTVEETDEIILAGKGASEQAVKRTETIRMIAEPKENVELGSEETITVTITTTKPHVEEKEIEIHIYTIKEPTVEIGVENGEVNLFNNETTTFTADVGDTNGTITYQWYYNDTAITGATNNTYSISTNEMTASNYKGGTYKVAVTNERGTVADSSEQTISALEIKTAEQLKNLATRVNEQGITFSGDTITQTADIDLSSVCGDGTNGSVNANWTPIGNETNSFAGTFDGDNYTINNLYISNELSYQGLFGINAGTITSVIVYNPNIKAYSNIGGITGVNEGTITLCSSQGGTIETTRVSDNSYIGGIAGKNIGIIEKSYNTSNITGHARFIGGITGHSSETIISCYNTGVVKGENSSGNLSGVHQGGIVGTGTGKVENCYNTGNIYAYGNVGGIIGDGVCTVTNCYNTGSISATNKVGGISGSNQATRTNCYYLQGTATGGISGVDIAEQAVSKSSSEMQTQTFANTLGAENWKLVDGKNDGYPVLEWQYPTYSINYNLDGGILPAGYPIQYISDDGVTLLNPTKEGYEFLGWTGSNGDTPQVSVTIPARDVGDKSYVANWEVNTYTVTLNTNGGTISAGNLQSYTYGVGAILPTNITKPYGIFGGWYDNAECNGNPITEITINDNGNKTYWAKWTEKSEYIVETADQLLCIVGERKFYKAGNGKAIASMMYFQSVDVIWNPPLLVSTDPNAVAYYTNDTNDRWLYTGSIEYDSQTWYFSSMAYWMPSSTGTTTDLLFLNTEATPYISMVQATTDLLDKYYGKT